MPGTGDTYCTYFGGCKPVDKPVDKPAVVEEFSHQSEKFSDECPVGMECDPARCVDGSCEGGFSIVAIISIAFVIGLAILCCICCYLRKKQDQENLDMIERQDEVIKNYQIAKMIISGTAFESLKLTVLQTRLHFVCISEYIVMRCNESS